MINWSADPWFYLNHPSIPKDFARWWEEWYGTPDDYPGTAEEQDEYWCRCAFALRGWRAALGGFTKNNKGNKHAKR